MNDLAAAALPFARVFVSMVLGVLAILHCLWAVGIWWPARNEDLLVAAVVGAPGAERMPGAFPCLVVAVGLAVVAVLPWLADAGWTGVWGGRALAAGATVFAVRGLLPLLPVWRRVTARHPFSTLDRRLYAPLSLALAAALGLLALS